MTGLQTKDTPRYLSMYLASAGSGKTYTLTNEYIRLALSATAEHVRFRHIVAITFTNKATEEMRSRILERLYKLSRDPDEQDESTFKLSADELRSRAKITLQQILYDYGHFAVSTIDVFFQRVVRAFLLEVNLPGDYRLTLDTDVALRKSVKDLFDAASSDDKLTDWLIQFVEERMRIGDKWDVEDMLVEFSKQIFSEKYLKAATATATEEVIPSKDKLSQLLQHIGVAEQTYVQELQKQATEAHALLDTHEICIEDIIYKKKGPFAIFKKIKDGQFAPEVLLTERVKKAAQAKDDHSLWIAKSCTKSQQVAACLDAGLQACFHKTYDFVEKEGISYNSLCAVRKYIYLTGLIANIEEQLRAYRDKEGVFFPTDVNEILRQLTTESHTPYLYEKVGTYYDHYLLDEFQDTSLFQWLSVQPLLANGVAEGHKQLVVGDRKQSIYRWRGAAPGDIAENIKKDPTLQPSLAKHTLGKNWRSAPVLVDLNSTLFEAIRVRMDEMAQADTHKDKNYTPFLDVYAGVQQKPAVAKKNEGYATITGLFVKEEPKRARCLVWLGEQIDALLGRGYQPGDICVLVRTRSEGKEVMSTLLMHASQRDTPYAVSSQEALLLEKSIAVRLLLATFTLLRADETESRNETWKWQWVQVYALYKALEKPDWQPSDEALENFWKQVKEKKIEEAPLAQLQHTFRVLKKLPLYLLSERLSSLFTLQKRPEERSFLYDFQSLLLQYQHQVSQQLKDFLAHWEQVHEKASLSAPTGVEAVQIMTIHKAKGLEFKVVLLPFCNWSFGHPSNSAVYLWKQVPDDPFFADDLLLLRYEKSLLHTRFADFYQEECVAAQIDALNLLYVACTRAAEELHICYETKQTPEKPSKSPPKEAGQLLHAIFFGEDPVLPEKIKWYVDEEPNRYVFTSGSQQAVSREKDPPSQEEKPVVAHDSQPDAPANQADWSDHILIRSNEDEAVRRQGILFHNIIAQINHQDDIPALLSALGSSEDARIVAERLEVLFKLPQVQDWFSGAWKMRHECTILMPNGEWCRPDLLLFQTARVYVVDFKTSPAEEQKHIKQLTRYVEQMTLLSGVDVVVSGFLVYVQPIQVRQVK